ncbi:hypothetical protein NL676_030518 [Syzygium grande]|nr:hypothetical protein NL676_030518 [Syzygium grande]
MKMGARRGGGLNSGFSFSLVFTAEPFCSLWVSTGRGATSSTWGPAGSANGGTPCQRRRVIGVTWRAGSGGRGRRGK